MFTFLLLLGTCFSSLLSPPFSPHALTPDSPLSRQGAALAHHDSFPPHDLVIWNNGSAPFPVAALASLPAAYFVSTESTLFFLASPVCSSFSVKARAVLEALRCSWQHRQVFYFSPPSLRLSLCPCHFVLSFIFSFT